MGGHGGNAPIDILKKGAIVTLLVIGLIVLNVVGKDQGIDPTPMLVLGFVVLASYTFGELVGVVKLPHITGYLLAGVLLGPSAAEYLTYFLTPYDLMVPAPFGMLGEHDGNLLSHHVQDTLNPFNALAIALITMTAGGELKWEEVRKSLGTILGVLGGQVALIVPIMVTFVIVISGQLSWVPGIGPYLAMPFKVGQGIAMGQLDLWGVLLVGGMVATVSLATSPAATIAVINGTQSKGPMTGAVLSAVVMKDVVVVLGFTVLAAIAGSSISQADLKFSGDGNIAHLEHASHGKSAGSGAPAATIVDSSSSTAHDTTHGSSSHHGSTSGGHHPKAPKSSPLEFAGQLSWEILGSLGIGILVGLGLAAYLRWVKVEILLFLLISVFVVSYVGAQAGLEPTLIFIAAGFAATNLSKEGESLIHEVERLGMPVYVVFFTLTGAHLDIGELIKLLPFVIPLVLARGFAIWLGIRAGTAVTGAPDVVKQHAWLGFISQAGVAIALAQLIGQQFGDTGATLQALLIAGVAVHEVIGPVALKVGLGLAGEIKSEETTFELEDEQRLVSDVPRGAPWQRPAGVPDPWGPDPDTGSPRLDRLMTGLKEDLLETGTHFDTQHFSPWAEDAQEYLGRLRKEFLRYHRHITKIVERDAPDQHDAIQREIASMADAWRDLVLLRGSELSAETWNPVELITIGQEITQSMPEKLQAPYSARSDQGPTNEGILSRIRRGLDRQRRSISKLFSGDEPSRVVPIKQVAAYHFQGMLPGRLEGLAALMLSGEDHLQTRTESLFTFIKEGYRPILHPEGELDPALLDSIRVSMDEEFALAAEETQRIAVDTMARLMGVFASCWRDMTDDLPVVNTIDLPKRKRRFSRVYRDQERAEGVLTSRYPRARVAIGHRYEALAMDLELVRLQAAVEDVVEQHADSLARTVKGRGITQLHRLETAVKDAVIATQMVLQEDLSSTALISALQEAFGPVLHIADEANDAAHQLQDEFSEHRSVSSLLDALQLASRDLTASYRVPSGPILHGEWQIPEPPSAEEVPFRELFLGFVETAITARLAQVRRSALATSLRLVEATTQFKARVGFNLDLSLNELDTGSDDTAPEQTKNLVFETLVENVSRAADQLTEFGALVERWDVELQNEIISSVIGELADLRGSIRDGSLDDVNIRMRREAAARRRLQDASAGISGLGNAISDATSDLLHYLVGPIGVHRFYRFLGLPHAQAEAVPRAEFFAEPEPIVDIPMVYRRLFSDLAMQVDNPFGSQNEKLKRVLDALRRHEGEPSHNAALMVPQGMDCVFAANTVLQQLETESVRRLQLEQPPTTDEIDQWFAGMEPHGVTLITGIEWLEDRNFGGHPLLAHFTKRAADHSREHSWFLATHSDVWEQMLGTCGIEDMFTVVETLAPLSPDELADAILIRHDMSGFKLNFDVEPGLLWSLRRIFQSSEASYDRVRDGWFNAFHQSTGGLLSDALRLWMTAIREVDEEHDTMTIGPVPTNPLDAILAFSTEDLLTLRQVSRRGTLSAEEHAWLFRTTHVQSRANLFRLENLGILVRTEDRFHMAPAIRGTVGRALKKAGWSQ